MEANLAVMIMADSVVVVRRAHCLPSEIDYNSVPGHMQAHSCRFSDGRSVLSGLSLGQSRQHQSAPSQPSAHIREAQPSQAHLAVRPTGQRAWRHSADGRQARHTT